MLGIDCRIAVARKHFAEINHVGYMEMHQRIRVAITGSLPHDVNRLAIQVESHHLRERNARTVDSQLYKLFRKRGRRPHDVTANAFQRLFLHGHERPPPSPPRIPFRLRRILRRNHHVPHRRLRAVRQLAADSCRAVRGRRSNQQRAIWANQRDHIAGPGGKHQHVRHDLRNAHYFLRPADARGR